jgi:hypothetical protein
MKYTSYNIKMTNNQWQEVMFIVVQTYYQFFMLTKSITTFLTICKVQTFKFVKEILRKKNPKIVVEKTISKIKFNFFTSKYNDKICCSQKKLYT